MITQFNAGPDITFPLFIYGAARTGVPVQVNVIGSMIFLSAVLLMVVNLIVQNRRSKRDAAISRGAVRAAQVAEAT